MCFPRHVEGYDHSSLVTVLYLSNILFRRAIIIGVVKLLVFTLNCAAVSKYGKVLVQYEKLALQYGFDIKKKSLMEDKRKYKVQRDHIHWNPKRQIPPVSLLFCGAKL